MAENCEVLHWKLIRMDIGHDPTEVHSCLWQYNLSYQNNVDGCQNMKGAKSTLVA